MDKSASSNAINKESSLSSQKSKKLAWDNLILQGILSEHHSPSVVVIKMDAQMSEIFADFSSRTIPHKDFNRSEVTDTVILVQNW